MWVHCHHTELKRCGEKATFNTIKKFGTSFTCLDDETSYPVLG